MANSYTFLQLLMELYCYIHGSMFVIGITLYIVRQIQRGTPKGIRPLKQENAAAAKNFMLCIPVIALFLGPILGIVFILAAKKNPKPLAERRMRKHL
jgi:hypothetical protein